jgi:hypothetical protein
VIEREGGKMSRRRYAAIAVLLGSFAVIVGSMTTWGTCSHAPCEGNFGLWVLVERSGVSWGPGVITLALGIVLAAVAIDALRGRASERGWWIGLSAAFSTLGMTLLWVIRMYVLPEFFLYGPGFGLYLVALGALVAAIASPWLRVREASRT